MDNYSVTEFKFLKGNLMKTIYPLGILAGMGPYSTAPFLNHVLDACKRLYGAKSDLDFPHIIIYSLPTPYHPEDKTYHKSVIESLETGINSLIKAGAEMIAVPCNSVHRYYNEMQEISSVPVLNIIDETVAKIKCSDTPIFIMGTQTTIEAGLYQLKLQDQPISWNEALQNKVDSLVSNFKANGVSSAALEIWKNIEDTLHKNNIHHVIICCTDLSFCANQSHQLIFYDSSAILAEKLVRKYIAHTNLKGTYHE